LVVLAATNPLIQRWFADRSVPGDDPYPLSVASNAGSLIGLLAYPLWIEPGFPLAAQWSGLCFGLAIAALVVVVFGLFPARTSVSVAAAVEPRGRLPLARILGWVALAALTNCLLASVTLYLTTDLAPVPLLWVVPLALYLWTWMAVFARRPWLKPEWPERALPWCIAALAPAIGVGLVQMWWLPLHLLVMLVACLVCHGRLAATRPAPGELTTFYLAIAVGGILGTAFQVLLAPILFNRVVEYPLALIASLLVLPGAREELAQPKSRSSALIVAVVIFAAVSFVAAGPRWARIENAGAIPFILIASGLGALVLWQARARPFRYALALFAALLACGLAEGPAGRVVLRARSFLGTLSVTRNEEKQVMRLVHGSTLHGEQSLEPDKRRQPRSYFTRSGPMGQIVAAARPRIAQQGAAVVGLGCGTLAAYAESGEDWSFFELDPEVVSVASNPDLFTFLPDIRAASSRVVIGDARQALRREASARYGLIVMDAFGSDAPPVHLLTREAVALYRDRLAPGGLVALNLSNRYLDLESVLGAVAHAEGLVCRVRWDNEISAEEKREEGKQGSIWGVLARAEADLGAIAADSRWRTPRFDSRPWTDDHADLVRHIRLESLDLRSLLPR
jgi:hypothetical protein